MSTIERRKTAGPQVSDIASEQTEGPLNKEASKRKASAGQAAPPGTASLVKSYERQKVEAARTAIADLARAVGADAASFASRYSGAPYANKSASQIQSQARFDFVRETLARRPDAADALVDVRLRGLDAGTQALARAAIAQSKTAGAARYAACEKALAALAPFNAEERRDVLGMVRAGEPFARAVELENKELRQVAGRPSAPTASTADLTKQALANADARAKPVRALSAQVHRTAHAIGKLTLMAETVAGVGAAAGTVGAITFAAGESVVRGSTKPMAKALHDAERAGGFIAGELTSKIREADRTAARLLQTGSRFESALARHKEAIRKGDHAEILETSKQLDALTEKIKTEAASLAAQAKSIGKLNKDFDGAAEHAALTLVISTLTVMLQAPVERGLHAAGHAVASRVAPIAGQTAAKAAGELAHHGAHAAAEGGIARGYGALRH